MATKLKLLRVQNKLTLEALAAEVELTRSYVSKVERGLSTPSISAALRIAKALKVPVEVLFGSEPAEDPVSIVRASADRTNTPRGLTRLVAGTSAEWRMAAFVLHPDKPDLRIPTSHHDGEELLYVLSGIVELQLVNRKEILHAGDCAHYDSALPHKISAHNSPESSVLVVISPRAPATAR